MIFGTPQDWHGVTDEIEVARILRVHKYRDASKVRKMIIDAAEMASKKTFELCNVTGKYIVKPIDYMDDAALVLKDGTRFNCPVFERHLHGCDHLLAFVITVGPDLDNEVIRLIEDEFEPLDALFLETTAWLTVEQATKNFAREMKEALATKGYGMSLRMGPGYEYSLPEEDVRVRWNLEEQRELFDLFGGSEMPVSLMESCAMQPKMSRSGVYGLRPIQ